MKSTKNCKILNYIGHLLDTYLYWTTFTNFVSIFGFACLLDTPIAVTSSTIGLKICAITAGIKNISQ